MAETRKLLVLRLQGPLQSWGDASVWEERNTWLLPSKSGVVGLIGAAMGLERGDQRLAELSDAITMAVRADRSGSPMKDFHTVTGHPLRNTMGKPKATGNTIITRREYIQDACFTVVIETDKEWHDRIAEALEDPHWPYYLGRRCCVPDRPVLEAKEPEFNSLMDALCRYPKAPRADERMPYETEKRDDSLPFFTKSDALSSGDHDFFKRTVWTGVITEE